MTEKQFMEAIVAQDGCGIEGLKEYAEKKMEMLEKRKAKDDERRKEKRLAGDALQASVFETLSEDYQTIDMICSALREKGYSETEASHNKVVNKLKNLVEGGKAIREDGKVPVENEEGKVVNRRVKVFRLA